MSIPIDLDYPLSDPHMRSMLSAFKCTGYVGLIQLIWNMAAVAPPSKQGDSPMTKIIKDRDGDRVIFDILLRIPEEVIIALIQNDIGWKYQNQQSFKKLLPPTGNYAGIYANVISFEKREGRFLSSNEVEVYASLVETYCQKTPKCKVSISIDKKTAKHTWNLQDTIGGDRYWIKANGKTWPIGFVQKLRDRVLVGGRLLEKAQYPKQSPLEVGCAINLQDRMKDHDIEGDMKGSTPAWMVGVNVLKSMDVRPIRLAFPIVYIMDYDREMQLAEILITIISGSMCDKGGYNSHPAGTTSIPKSAVDYAYLQEKLYIHHSTPYYSKAVEATFQDLTCRYDAMIVATNLNRSVPDLTKNLLNPLTADEMKDMMKYLHPEEEILAGIKEKKQIIEDTDYNIDLYNVILELKSAAKEQVLLDAE